MLSSHVVEGFVGSEGRVGRGLGQGQGSECCSRSICRAASGKSQREPAGQGQVGPRGGAARCAVTLPPGAHTCTGRLGDTEPQVPPALLQDGRLRPRDGRAGPLREEWAALRLRPRPAGPAAARLRPPGEWPSLRGAFALLPGLRLHLPPVAPLGPGFYSQEKVTRCCPADLGAGARASWVLSSEAVGVFEFEAAFPNGHA